MFLLCPCGFPLANSPTKIMSLSINEGVIVCVCVCPVVNGCSIHCVFLQNPDQDKANIVKEGGSEGGKKVGFWVWN